MSLLWYDLETFGINPHYDRIAQFAALRTDENLQPIEDPIVLYGKLSPDYLPDPRACLVTGITPEDVNANGLVEAQMIAQIDRHFSMPGTCCIGFNNIAFDDEFIRNLYYRNFYDPYFREWANGNSRWDILGMVQAAHDLRPEGINWPTKDDGRHSVKLELMTQANNLDHDNAHDALSDVYATIALARIIREKQPKLYEWAWNHRSKDMIRSLIDLENKTPVVHSSSCYGPNVYSTLVCPLAADPSSPNTVYAFDLRTDPEDLLALSNDEIRKRIFTPRDQLKAEGLQPIPLVRIAVNRCPFIAPHTVLDDEALSRLGIDMEQALTYWKRIRDNSGITAKICQIYNGVSKGFQNQLSFDASGQVDDIDLQLYSGFFPDEDKEILNIIRNTEPAELGQLNIRAKDLRIPEMLRRYRGRNFPETLDDGEMRRWKSYCASRILSPRVSNVSDLGEYRKRINMLMDNVDLESHRKPILKSLMKYGDELEKMLLSSDN